MCSADDARQATVADLAPETRNEGQGARRSCNAAIIHGAMTHVARQNAAGVRRYFSRNATSFVLQLRRCQRLVDRCSAAQRRPLETAARVGRSVQPWRPQAPQALPLADMRTGMAPAPTPRRCGLHRRGPQRWMSRLRGQRCPRWQRICLQRTRGFIAMNCCRAASAWRSRCGASRCADDAFFRCA